jgi:hypothetical protein
MSLTHRGLPLVVSLSNHEPSGSPFDQYILSELLILRQAQDERVEGLRASVSGDPWGSSQ